MQRADRSPRCCHHDASERIRTIREIYRYANRLLMGCCNRRPAHINRHNPHPYEAARQCLGVDLVALCYHFSWEFSQEPLRLATLLISERPTSTVWPALCASGSNAGASALADHLALELRERGDEMKVERAHRRCRVDGIHQTDEVNAFLCETSRQFDKLQQRTSQAIKTPNDQGVALFKRSKRSIETGPFELRTRYSVVGKNAITRCPL